MITKRVAREIRAGIIIARKVIRRERVAPSLTPFGFAAAPRMALWELAYLHEITAAVRDGRIQPPRGRAGA